MNRFDNDRPVDLKRLQELLDAYGAESGAWPEGERAAAQRLLKQDSQARALHAEALALDALLAEPEALEISPALRARVLEIPIRHPHRGSAGARARSFFGLRWAAMALVPCMIGFLSGTLLMDTSDNSDDDAWNEITSLTSATNDVLDEDLDLP